ncbi:MAG: DUF2083 domain-containing protein [Planctomycetes bacterium]|nr:DUF2083 domain-containing protein [Planctomycetota bacterium]MCC7169703.1 DUF2083 domain-containing protein [Planctomycetota bacterium]
MADATRFGKRLRQLRDRVGLTQVALAQRLGISPSYLNLMEHDRRPLPAAVLVKLAQEFDVDVRSFGGGAEARLASDLTEVFGDPLFDAVKVPADEIQEVARQTPAAAAAIVHLFHAWEAARASANTMAERALEPGGAGSIDPVRLSSEQVSDLLQKHMNHFPELEEAAEVLRREARLSDEELFSALARHLERAHGVKVKVDTVQNMRGALRRFDPATKTLVLSEVLRRGSRNFQLAHQAALLTVPALLDHVAADPVLTSDESRRLARIALASYFASAVVMPYDAFLAAAEAERYDVDLLGHRFRTSFEQVAHRLTTLRRRGREGIPFHMVRVDIAGNISKKFSATAVRFPRFSGLCPLWDVHAAFLRPGFIRVQISKLQDGSRWFSVARTVRKHRGGYHARNVLQAIGLGCALEDAHRLVYADGIDLHNTAAAIPVGMTCRLCERMDCEARAFPPVQKPLSIDENVLGMSFYAPVGERKDA